MQKKAKTLKVFTIYAEIISQITNEGVWQGLLEDVVATNRKEAAAEATKRIENTIPEYDSRINPVVHIVSVEPTPFDPLLFVNTLMARIEKRARKSADPDHVAAELQAALQCCFEQMTPVQVAKALKAHQDNAGDV